MPEFLHNPFGSKRLGTFISDELANRQWNCFRAAVAFVRSSGVKHIAGPLRDFLGRGGEISLVVGVDLGGTTREGLEALLAATGESAELRVLHNKGGSTFHPKIYVFSNADEAELIVGSGNLTEAGLFKNYEAGIHLSLSRSKQEDAEFLDQILEVMDSWSDLDSGITLALTSELIEKLVEHGYVRSESEEDMRTNASLLFRQEDDSEATGLFSRQNVPEAPRVEMPSENIETQDAVAVPDNFVMLLQKTDAGYGQVTPGTSRRSPEIFIPLAALRKHEDFWGFPDDFREDPHRSGKMDRKNVRVLLSGQGISVNMMTWPVKHDFRLRNAELRDSAAIGDILHLRRIGGLRVDYQAELISPSNPEYQKFLAQCDNPVINSNKRFGYY